MMLHQITRLCSYKPPTKLFVPVAAYCPQFTKTSPPVTSTSGKICIRLQYNKRDSLGIEKTKLNENLEQPTSVFSNVDALTANNAKAKLDVDSKWVEIDTKWHQYPKIYMSLSKWYLTLFVAMTADAGFCLAPVAFEHHNFFFMTVGVFLSSCAANTFNQVFEVPYDAQMERTKNRPLVRNVISPLHATTFGIVSGVTGVSCLYFGVNGLTAALGLGNIFLYAAIYTSMKRRHWFNTWIGAIVGGIPPIMGWTAAIGTIDPGAFILAGILYSWQFPHFYSLAWRRRGDYAKGSYHMLPLSYPEATKSVAVIHSLALCGLCLAAPLTGVTSWAFVGMSAPFNIWIMREATRFYRRGNSNSASRLYKCSLYYILAVSLVLVLDRKLISKSEKKAKLESMPT